MLSVDAPVPEVDLGTLRVGERVDGLLLVVEATVGTTRTLAATPYLKAKLRDRAGRTLRAILAADYAASRLEGVFDLVEAPPEGTLWTERSGMFGEPLYLGWR